MPKKKHPTALAALVEDSGLSYGTIEKLAFVKAPKLKGAGREPLSPSSSSSSPSSS